MKIFPFWSIFAHLLLNFISFYSSNGSSTIVIHNNKEKWTTSVEIERNDSGLGSETGKSIKKPIKIRDKLSKGVAHDHLICEDWSGGCSLKKFVRVQKRRGLTPWTALALACIKITSSRNLNLKTIEIKASKLLVKFIKVQSHLDLPGGPPSWHSTCDNSHAVGRYYR